MSIISEINKKYSWTIEWINVCVKYSGSSFLKHCSCIKVKKYISNNNNEKNKEINPLAQIKK